MRLTSPNKPGTIILHVHDAGEAYPINVGKLMGEYRKKIKRSMRGVQIFDKYDPNEARDPTGKWTAGGGSARKPQETKQQTISFVSPNEDPNNLSFEQAVDGLKTKRQKLLHGISHQIDSDLGIKDIRVNHVIGAWSDGAENSVMTNSESTDPDIEEVAAVMKGYLANQKAVLLFHPDDVGQQFMAQFRVKSNDLAGIHKKLLDSDITFHTLEPRGDDTVVHFYGEDEADLHQFAATAKKFDQKVQIFRGHGKFIPPELEGETDEEQRAASREAYKETIRRVADTGKLPSGFESKWKNHIDNWQRETGERIGETNYWPSEPTEPTSGEQPGEQERLSEEEFLKGEWLNQPTDKPTSVKVRQSNGDITQVDLPTDVVEHARTLKEAPDRYFKTETEGTELIPVNKLVQTRARPEGIAHAVQLMAAAYQGEGGKRGPIHVQKLDDGHYLVLDGNSTTTIATAAGWQHMPAIVIPDASYLPKKEPKKTKDHRWRSLIVHTLDGVFRLRLRDAEFNRAEHPFAPAGTKGEYKGGEFVPKGTGGAAKAAQRKANTPPASRRGKREAGEREEAEWKAGTKSQPEQKPKRQSKEEKDAYSAKPTDTKKPLQGSKGHKGLVSTVIPADGRDPNQYQQAGRDYVKSTDPDQYKANISVFDNSVLYPLPQDTFHGSDDEVYDKIKAHIKSNLKFIYDNISPEEVESTKKWYDGARKMVDRKVEQYKKYNIKDTTVAGLYACLSPINLWDQNVRQADQMIDIYCKQQDHKWDADMERVSKTWKSGDMKILSDAARGNKLKDIADPAVKAQWIRLYDMAHNTGGMEWDGKKLEYQPFHAITPDGEYHEWYLTDKGEPQKFGWHTPDMMEKAVRILDSDGDRDVISANLGVKHKVRSFYNNILDPNSENEDVTMDTHAIDAAWLMDAPAAVLHNFGLGPQQGEKPYGWERGSAGSVKSGVEGTYGIYADAYRELAHDLKIRPRELQSIVWEAKRKWMGNMTPDELNRVAHLWKNYQEGRIPGGLQETQRRVKAMVDESKRLRDEKARQANEPQPPKEKVPRHLRFRSTPSWQPADQTDPYEYAFMPTKAKKGQTPPPQPENEPLAEPPKSRSNTPQYSEENPDPIDEYEIYAREEAEKRRIAAEKAYNKAHNIKKPKAKPPERRPEDYEYGY